MTNYYDFVKDKCKVVYRDEIDFDIYKKANENPDNYIILVDPDVDFVTVFDKVNKVAYDVPYKGYELLEAGVVGNLKIEYGYIEDYLD